MTIWHRILAALNRDWHREHGDPLTQDDPRLYATEPPRSPWDDEWPTTRNPR